MERYHPWLPIGTPGPQGDPGPAGADGAQGLQGNPGADGAQGIQGIQGIQGNPGPGVPAGGTTSQVLQKTSDTDYATGWVTPPGGSGADPPEGSYAPGSYTIATGKFRHAVKRQQFTGTQRLTIQGTGRLSLGN